MASLAALASLEEDLKAARKALGALEKGRVRDCLESSLGVLSRDVARECIAAGKVPRRAEGILELLREASDTIQESDDVVFLVVHFLLLQRGWVMAEAPISRSSAVPGVAAGTASRAATTAADGVSSDTMVESGIHRLLPPGWLSDAPRKGACKILYKNKANKLITVTGMRLEDMVIIHAHGVDEADTCTAEVPLQGLTCSPSSLRGTKTSAVGLISSDAVETVRGLLKQSIFPSASNLRKRRASKQDGGAQKGLHMNRGGQSVGREGLAAGAVLTGRRGASGQSGWGFEDDLNPFGSGTGGSLVGPGHPAFRNAGRPGYDSGSPFPGVPPGARFDPFGPTVGPGRNGGGGRRGFGRGRGSGRGFNGPTPDHLPPPSGMPTEFDFMYQ